jgi:hypothetical protein
MSEVPKVLTPLTELELLDVIYVGHQAVFSEYPSLKRLSVAWAQLALELDRGKAIWNNNLGNISAGSKWIGDYYSLHVPPPDPPVIRFRAHDTSLDGAIDYWKFLSAPRYAQAIFYFDKGDAFNAAVQLGAVRYYLANVAIYAKDMASLEREFFRRGLDQAEVRLHETITSPTELANAGRLWRLAEDVEQGVGA